jgi:ABC-2 type transport system permease protein
MNKILAIAWKNVYITYRDRNLLLIMLATPLALSIIIGLAFGGLGSGTGGITDVPVAIVNLDSSIEQNGQTFNFGETLVGILNPTPPTSDSAGLPECPLDTTTSDPSQAGSLDGLLNVSVLSTPEEARQGVADGDYTVAVIIPENFSSTLLNVDRTDATTTIEVLGSSASPIRSGIVRSITEGIANSFVSGNIAIRSTVNALVQRAQSDLGFGITFAANATTWQPNFSCAFSPNLNTLTLTRDAVTLNQQRSAFAQILVTIGTAQAMFFALFTGQGSFSAIYEERKAGTLQRMAIAPMQRRDILSGYVLGAFITVALQLIFLLIALTLVASAMEGVAQLIWGTNPILLGVVIAMTLSVCGIGVLVASVARTTQQANVVGPILFTFMAFLGGTFGVQMPVEIARLSPIYWAVDALNRLSNGNPDILLNMVVLIVQGLVMFVVGLFLFNRNDLV